MKITTEVLDNTYGQSAAGVRARLERAGGNDWITVAVAETNRQGCVEDWDSWRLEPGLYRIVFDSDGYFASLGAAAAYPEVVVMFRIVDALHTFQIRVNLSPYSYSTYFGTADS
jgi:5-hydroxyisourate hydrolase